MIKKLSILLFTSVVVLMGSNAQAQTKNTKTLKHVVMITFKEGAPANEIKEVDDSFKNLAEKLKVVKSYEWGIANAQEQSKANVHVYVFGFSSMEDLVSYGASPEHQLHIKVGVSITERVQAIDYWTEK
jgi:hypothetical protein